jgi:hypothetical protein
MINPIRLIFLLSIFTFSCSGPVTDHQRKEYDIQQSVLKKNRAILIKAAETINKTGLSNDIIEMPLDKFVMKNKIEPAKIDDLISTLSTLADVFKNVYKPDTNEEKLLISKVQENLEILDISIQTGFSFNVSKIDTTKVIDKGNDTIILK